MDRLQDAVDRITAWLLAAGDAHLLVLSVAAERAREHGARSRDLL